MSASGSPRWNIFLQAIGLRPTFRRRRGVFGPASLVNFCVAAGLGIVSGQYIFKEPLEQYWKEQHQLLEQQRAASSQGDTTTTTTTASNNNNNGKQQ